MTTTAELRSKRERKEQEISDIAHRIEDRIESYKDWHKVVQDYPLQSVGVAVGAGLLFTGFGGGLLRFAFRQAEGIVRASVVAYVMATLSDMGEKRKVVNTQTVP